MKKFTAISVFSLVVAALVATPNVSHAQTNLYSALTLPAAAQTGALQYLEIVDPANGAGGTAAAGAGTYTLTAFEVGLNFSTGLEDQGVIVTFYTGVDTSAGATDALATATMIAGVGGNVAAPGAAGNFTYTFTLNSAITLPTTDGAFGVEFQLTDSTFDAYADDINGRFSAVAPTIGTSPGYVWNDANLDGAFAGSEQTKFGQAGAYVRFSAGGSFAAVPEPGAYAFCVLGLAVVGVLTLRRRHACV